jgi:hypothetical protein
VPFDKGCAVDERYVVEVDDLPRISRSLRRLPDTLTLRCSSNFGCALVSLILVTWQEAPSYATVLRHWNDRELCRKSDGAPKRRHGSPNACMVKKEGSRAAQRLNQAYHSSGVGVTGFPR